MSLSPAVTVNGSAMTPAVAVTAGSTVTIALISGAQYWAIACTSTDETNTASAINATLVVNQGTKTATFTAPASVGSAVIFTSTVGVYGASVGAGLDQNKTIQPTLTTTFKVNVLAAGGYIVMAANETTEQSAASGWTAIVNAAARGVSSAGTGATQQTTALSNGINSNVVGNGKSSLRFSGNTGAVILGGIVASSVAAGQPTDLSFIVPGFAITIRNEDASSTAANRIRTPTGQDVLLAPGQAANCRLVYDGTISRFVLQHSSVVSPATINVLDFGFTPGSSGTPCDTQMAALLAYVTASGVPWTILFPAGQYYFTSTIPAFPAGCIFLGTGHATNAASTLIFLGTGIFWQLGSGQTAENLLVISQTQNAYTAAPAQEAVISGVTIGANPTVTTVNPHGYTNGDLIGAYGVVGVAGGINTDPAYPIAVSGCTTNTFVMPGITTTGSYSSTSKSVSGAVQSGSNILLTLTAHGLVADQVVYATSPGSGFTWTSGVYRVTVVDVNHIKLYTNFFTGSTGTGVYTSGGTVQWGGVATSNSHIPLVGINIQGPSGNLVYDTLRNVSCGGFKYGFSFDSPNGTHAEMCAFDYLLPGFGYGNAQLSDNRTHSACGIRMGAFLTGSGAQGTANQIVVNHTTFSDYYCGILHHDGISHTVNNGVYENQVGGFVMNAEQVIYDGAQNDGSIKDFLQVYSDGTTVGPFNVAMRNSYIATSAGAALLGSPSNLSGTTPGGPIGVTFQNNEMVGTGTPIQAHGQGTTWQGPYETGGNIVTGGGTSLADFPMQGASEGGATTTIGQSLNHPGDTAGAALDIQILSYAVPGLVVRDGSQTKFLELGLPSSFFGTTALGHEQLMNANSGSPGAIVSLGKGFVQLASGASATQLGGWVPTPLTLYGAHGGVTARARIVANLSGVDGSQARWEIEQQLGWAGSVLTLLGTPTLRFKEDLSSGGGFPDPVFAITSNTLFVQASGYSGTQSQWAARVDFEYVGF